MRVVVVSDTHGSVTAWRKITDVVGKDELFLHLGDVLYHGPRNPIPNGYDPKNLSEILKEFRIDFVRGNCDADVDIMVLGLPEVPKVAEQTFGNWKVLMVHGEDLDDEIGFAKKHGADVLLRGHTHIPKITNESGVIVLNPGSPSIPKGGFPPTFSVLDFSDNSLKIRILDLNGLEIMEEVFEYEKG